MTQSLPSSPSIDLSDLVTANRILAHEGILDAFGHVSLRNPHQPAHFIISRSLGPEQVTEADLQEFRIADLTQVSGNSQPAYSERAIHAGIYEARPDVLAVCHNHSPSTIPFGAAGVPLRPIMHMAGGLGVEVPLWDPQDDFGDTDMLVRTLDQGRSLARALGSRRVTLMRGHGSVVTGATVKEVVICAIYMERNALLQLQAAMLGGNVRFLTNGEIEQTAPWLVDPVIQARAWGTWEARASKEGQ